MSLHVCSVLINACSGLLIQAAGNADLAQLLRGNDTFNLSLVFCSQSADYSSTSSY